MLSQTRQKQVRSPFHPRKMERELRLYTRKCKLVRARTRVTGAHAECDRTHSRLFPSKHNSAGSWQAQQEFQPSSLARKNTNTHHSKRKQLLSDRSRTRQQESSHFVISTRTRDASTVHLLQYLFGHHRHARSFLVNSSRNFSLLSFVSKKWIINDNLGFS